MTNNKTNDAVHPQKMHPSSKGQNNAGGGGTYYLSPRQIDPKSSAGGVTHGAWMMPVRLVGMPLGHRQWWGLKPPTTMVRRK
jgi:hypothetical protein